MMSNHSSHRNGRPFLPLLGSSNSSDPGQMCGPSREMAPPFQSHSVDINLDGFNSSRTLPSLSALSNAWESANLQSGFGDGFYNLLAQPKAHQNPVGSPARGVPVPNPILQWYTDSNDPWIPKVIPDVSVDRTHSRQNGNRHHAPFGGQYKQTSTSDTESFFGVPPSDSGYGTRRSVGNTSVFSGDVAERDQDCQSLVGHVADLQPFQGSNDGSQYRDTRTSNPWISSPSLQDIPGFVCPTCRKTVKTQSELKKHELRHTKPFKCTVDGCPRTEGFSTTNDLERHTLSKHPSVISDRPVKTYRCLAPGCKSKDKMFPRLDNFRNHLKRMHGEYVRLDEDFEEMIRRGETFEKIGSTLDKSTQEPQEMGTMPSRKAPAEQETSMAQRRPEVIEPSRDLTASTESSRDMCEVKSSPPEEKHTQPEVSPQDTVQPLDVFGISTTKIPESKFSLNHVLLTPVGHEKNFKLIDNKTSTASIVGTQSQGKTPKQTQVSAADAATLTEVIKGVLVGTNNQDRSNELTAHGNLQNSLPETKHHDSWASNPKSNGTQDCKNPADSLPSEDECRNSEARKKAVELLKAMQDLGYTVHKEPNHPPKIQNAGSVASNKSEHQVTCQVCQKFKGRPCELKKHMKRHQRPYGCTFLTCNKSFGSKNDWKRHENSQHYHLETWRCDEERPEGGTCAKVCYRRQTFQEHLKREHEMMNPNTMNRKLDRCRIGRNCQARFWCGFCLKLIDLKKTGLEAWNERFDHIDNHFMGRSLFDKKSIQDWVPVDSDKPKGEDDFLSDSRTSRSGRLARASPKGNSPNYTVPGSSSANAINLDDSRRLGAKRSRSHDGEGRHSKHPRTASPSEIVVYCCGCNMAHNPKLDDRCTGCTKSHRFCPSCIREERQVGNLD